MSNAETSHRENGERVQSLSEAAVGSDLRIRALEGSENSCAQLRRLGFCESIRVRKLGEGRNLVCSVCGTRMALSRKLADQVLVSQEPS
jgi:ferrous iron transport protein A